MDWRKSVITNGNRPPGRPLPRGVVDRFWQEAAALREVQGSLRDLFRRWGYSEYIPPTFEYAETLSTGAGAPLEEQMYRFFDRDGKMLALRPDMTIPTARLVGSKLFDQPFPQRFFYTGPVFRYNEPLAGLQREFYQAGVELIGVEGAEGDGEVLALAVAALRALGLENFRIVLGQMRFFRGLLQALQLDRRDEEALRLALDRKSDPALQALVDAWGISGRAREALMRLPRLHGANGVLRAAEEVVLNAQMQEALDNLRAIERVLDAYGVTRYVTLDLAEVRGMDYYTGITFEGFVPGLGVALLSGGRYDDLVGKFGPAHPAVGFAITLERALRAREAQNVPAVRWAPDVIVGGCVTAAGVSAVQAARDAGVRVAWYYRAEAQEEVWAHATAVGATWAVWCEGDYAWLWREGEAQQVPLEAWVQVVLDREAGA